MSWVKSINKEEEWSKHCVRRNRVLLCTAQSALSVRMNSFVQRVHSLHHATLNTSSSAEIIQQLSGLVHISVVSFEQFETGFYQCHHQCLHTFHFFLSQHDCEFLYFAWKWNRKNLWLMNSYLELIGILLKFLVMTSERKSKRNAIFRTI